MTKEDRDVRIVSFIGRVRPVDALVIGVFSFNHALNGYTRQYMAI